MTGTFLEELDEQNQEVEFRELMTNSVWYVLLNRCGLDVQMCIRDRSGFVKREKKNLVPTDDGNVLITVLPDEIKSPKMTAEWEMALNHIAQNTETADEFLNGITELMQELGDM